MLEVEKSYLAKFLPAGIENCKNKEIIDIYIVGDNDHPTLRLRKNGDRHVITRKEPVREGDTYVLKETTIPLSEAEFNSLRQINGRVLHKIRYYYPYKDRVAEIGVYQGALKGLVMVDVEFDNEEDLKNFEMPGFCLLDAKDCGAKEFLAGGMLCGKSYEEIQDKLSALGYQKIL